MPRRQRTRNELTPALVLSFLGTVLLVAAAQPASSQSSPGTRPASAPSSLAYGAMPHPSEFFRGPADAGAVRGCPGKGLRREPANLGIGRDADPRARSAVSLLLSWARRHYRFEGSVPLCVDGDFVVSSWQRMMGLPVTGVLTVAEVDSIQAERLRTEPEFQAASRRWTEARVAARAAGVLPPNPSRAQPGSEQAPAVFQRPAPVGPPEKQAFGLSLGVDFLPQLQICPRGWSSRSEDSPVSVCFVPAASRGRTSTAHLLEFERELVDTVLTESNPAAFDADGAVGVFFAPAARPGLLELDGLRAWLFDGRLEAIGFVPSDKQSVIDAFTSRFGPPAYEPVPMRNTEGATWIGDRYRFRRGDVTATLNCVGFNTEDCSFAQIMTDRARDGLAGRRQRDAAKGVAF